MAAARLCLAWVRAGPGKQLSPEHLRQAERATGDAATRCAHACRVFLFE